MVAHGPIAALQLVLRRLPLVALMVLAVVAVGTVLLLLNRYEQERRGVGAVREPSLREVLDRDEAQAAELPPAGRFTAPLTFTLLDAPGSGEVTLPVTWDDAWFSAPADVYNHVLARTASVLAALAYSESGYYQAASTQPAYMEQALAHLGFTEVSTASYQYRSEVVDQVLNVFTADEDDVAYTIARKRVADEAAPGGVRAIVLVSVRGSYGSEWLSNFDFLTSGGAGAAADTETKITHSSADDAGAAAATTADTGGRAAGADVNVAAADTEGRAASSDADAAACDTGVCTARTSTGAAADTETNAAHISADDARGSEHAGYGEAAREVWEALAPWIEESHAAEEPVSLLVTGHSRGGAVANLVAARAAYAQAGVARAAADAGAGAAFSDSAGAISPVAADTSSGTAPDVASDAASCAASSEGAAPASSVAATNGTSDAISDDAAATSAPASSGSSADPSVVPSFPLNADDAVYAYTFASPRTTISAAAHTATFAGIFNVVHPADLMPELPLASWGYERYGCDVALPRAGDAAFAERYERMAVSYRALVGKDPAFDPAQAQVVDDVTASVAARVAAAEDLLTPQGVAATLAACVEHVDPFTILEGHYPSVYIAWMDALDATEVAASTSASPAGAATASSLSS